MLLVAITKKNRRIRHSISIWKTMAEELSKSCMYINRKEPRNQLIRVIYGIQRHSATDTVRDDPINVINIAYLCVN